MARERQQTNTVTVQTLTRLTQTSIRQPPHEPSRLKIKNQDLPYPSVAEARASQTAYRARHTPGTTVYCTPIYEESLLGFDFDSTKIKKRRPEKMSDAVYACRIMTRKI